MLNIAENHRHLLISEFRHVAAQMRATSDVGDKLYFLTATWAMVQRVFNIEYDSELVFAYQVLQQAWAELGRPGPSNPRQLAGPVIERLLTDIVIAIDAVADQWERGEDATDLFKRIAVIGYTATGNGVYLLTKRMGGISSAYPTEPEPPS